MQNILFKSIIVIATFLTIQGCKNNPTGSNVGYYSSTVILSSPADSASLPSGNVTFIWRKPVADQVLSYQIMINGVIYNATDTFYNHYFQNIPGVFPWIVYANVVDTNYTSVISSVRRYVIIH